MLYGAILFLIICILAEIVARSSFVQEHIPYQAYGTNHTQLELQLNNLDNYIRKNGVPDCFIFGSSQAFREVDAVAFSQAFSTASGEQVVCYNFGVTGSQVWTTSILNKFLIQKYQPRLVVIGTSFLDYTEGRELQIDERFKENDWLKYQTGQFTLGGWLTENSYAWRVLTLFSYAAPFGMHYEEVWHEARKWDGIIHETGFALASGRLDVGEPADPGFVKNFTLEMGNFGISESNLAALHETITFSQQEGAQVLLAEMVYHPDLLELKDGKGNPRIDQTRMLTFIETVNARLNTIAANHSITFMEFDPNLPFSNEHWFDLYHLNRDGAAVFSQWLGEQAAQIIDILPPNSSEGN